MPGREASLDVQYALAIARGVETSFWSIANSNDPFSDFLFQLADMEQPPHVISLSYGFTETASTFAAFQTAINQQLRKATARGITVIAATGDEGVGGGGGRYRHESVILCRICSGAVKYVHRFRCSRSLPFVSC